MKILFVCRGNVGRSQMAEALFKKYKNDNHHVVSAGTKLSGPEQPIKELIPATENVIEVMKEEGIDISDNVRNQLTPEMAREADKIVLVCDDNDPIPEYLKGDKKVTHWNLPDPKGTSIETHRKIRDAIKKLIQEEKF